MVQFIQRPQELTRDLGLGVITYLGRSEGSLSQMDEMTVKSLILFIFNSTVIY